MDNLFKMFGRITSPTVPLSEEENVLEVDEPPDDRVPELNLFRKENVFARTSSRPEATRRESLLTRELNPRLQSSPTSPKIPRGLSTTSSVSFASTAELTDDLESPVRSASPSPPPPPGRVSISSAKPSELPGRIVIAPVTADDKPVVVSTGEAALEKTLGRKRCIMFACNDAPAEKDKEKELIVETTAPREAEAEAPVRKCRISFACPTKPAAEPSAKATNQKVEHRRQSSPAPTQRTMPPVTEKRRATEAGATTNVPRLVAVLETRPESKTSPKQAFHEFGSSHEEPEEWVVRANEASKPKLTIDDCLKKENAIRKIGEEVQEEAEEEERQLDDLENEIDDDNDGEDDFAPSDEDNNSSDGGNESDDENGFAASDNESDHGSEYEFWAPYAAMPATSADNGTHFSMRQTTRSRASSTSSTQSESFDRRAPSSVHRRPKGSKPIKMRPGTPELPDSTDFVCGTFDEDRPLEAAYISCRDLRRKEKHVPIPQDIDPSFPTTDPEEEEDEVDEQDPTDSSEQPWMKNQFEGFDDEGTSRRPSAIKISPLHSPTPMITPMRPHRPMVAIRNTNRSPPPPNRPTTVARNTNHSPPPPAPHRPSTVARNTNRSPPPPSKHRARSPAPPRRLFDRQASRLQSPPPSARLRSPRGSPVGLKGIPLGITINRLAQRPNAEKTSSLPHTPNPFFRNWQQNTNPGLSRVQSLATSPGQEEPQSDMHVRGPVDIVIGLEKKRQKRKEKYWRQHVRKAAKHPEKRPPQGKGLERMKELGLERAERVRGYNIGQQPQLVLSI